MVACTTGYTQSMADNSPGRTPDTDPGGPESIGPSGTASFLDQPAPSGVSEDSPADEGSELTAVPKGRLGERRAAPSAEPDEDDRPGQDLGSIEPTQMPEAGPQAAPDPAPPRRPFPASGSGP
jgi:hypothetical protein